MSSTLTAAERRRLTEKHKRTRSNVPLPVYLANEARKIAEQKRRAAPTTTTTTTPVSAPVAVEAPAEPTQVSEPQLEASAPQVQSQVVASSWGRYPSDEKEKGKEVEVTTPESPIVESKKPITTIDSAVVGDGAFEDIGESDEEDDFFETADAVPAPITSDTTIISVDRSMSSDPCRSWEEHEKIAYPDHADVSGTVRVSVPMRNLGDSPTIGSNEEDDPRELVCTPVPTASAVMKSLPSLLADELSTLDMHSVVSDSMKTASDSEKRAMKALVIAYAPHLGIHVSDGKCCGQSAIESQKALEATHVRIADHKHKKENESMSAEIEELVQMMRQYMQQSSASQSNAKNETNVLVLLPPMSAVKLEKVKSTDSEMKNFFDAHTVEPGGYNRRNSILRTKDGESYRFDAAGTSIQRKRDGRVFSFDATRIDLDNKCIAFRVGASLMS
jgi:hypothetical protein